jgi:Trk-type K+ transport system membrane component
MAVGNNHEGMVKYSLITTEELVEAGTLFTVTFTVDSKAVGAHDFQFYAVDCSDYDMNKLTTNVAKATVTVSGAAVSDVTVEPVTSVDQNGSQVVIKSEVNSTVSKVEQTPVEDVQPQVEKELLPTWGKVLLIGVAVLAVAAIVVIVVMVLFTMRGKKPQKQPVEYTAILDEKAADLLSESTKSEDAPNE